MTNKFVDTLDHHAPMRIIQTRLKYVPWLTDSTKELMNKRNLAQQEASVSQSIVDWNRFKKLRNEITKRLGLSRKTGSRISSEAVLAAQEISGSM